MLFGVPSLKGRFGLISVDVRLVFKIFVLLCFNEKIKAMGRENSGRKKKKQSS